MTAPIRRLVVSVDLTYRGAEYRLVEPYRSGGARIQSAPDHRGCSECGRVIRQYAQSVWITAECVSHPACAIRSGFLALVGRSLPTTADGVAL